MNILYITNLYPTLKKSHFGIFVKNQIDSIRKKGINTKVICIGKDFGGYHKIFSIKNEINWSDIIHCHFGHIGTLALFWKLFKNKPLVVSYCGDDLLGSVGSDEKYHFKGKILASINSFFSKFIDFAIVKSDTLFKKVKAKNVEVIPSGVDINLFKEVDRRLAEGRIGLNDSKLKRILFLGQRNIPVKNFSLFEMALKYLDFKFETLILENIPYEDVVYYMNSSDVCVLTSFHEGSPNVIKEAMACNRPIVSVDVGDVKWLLEGIEGCFVVSHNPCQIAEAIKKAINFNKTNARQKILDLGLDLESIADRIVNIYKKILK